MFRKTKLFTDLDLPGIGSTVSFHAMKKKRKAVHGRPSLWKGPTEDKVEARVSQSDKAAMQREARRDGVSLSEWIRRTLIAQVLRRADKRRGRAG